MIKCKSNTKAVFIALYVSLICYLNQPANAKTAEYQSFSVSVTESSASPNTVAAPVILIPGLMSDGSVWQSTVDELRKNHQVHVVHISGFAGKPAIAGPLLPIVKTELLNYIREQKLNKPVVIGHSLGGYMAFALATSAPDLIGPIVAVDGLPYLAPVFTRDAKTQVSDMQQQAAQIKLMYQQFSAEQFRSTIAQGLFIQASAGKNADQVLAMAMASDRSAVGQAMFELLTSDLRPELAKLRQPVLLLGAGGALPAESMRPAVTSLYQQQLAAAPQATLEFNWQSRHFIMLDDPQWMFNKINKFLQGAR